MPRPDGLILFLPGLLIGAEGHPASGRWHKSFLIRVQQEVRCRAGRLGASSGHYVGYPMGNVPYGYPSSPRHRRMNDHSLSGVIPPVHAGFNLKVGSPDLPFIGVCGGEFLGRNLPAGSSGPDGVGKGFNVSGDLKSGDMVGLAPSYCSP